MEQTRPATRFGLTLDYKAPLLVLLALLLTLAVATTVFWSRTILYPYGLENGEGFVLDSSLAVAQGRSPYKALDDYPLTVGNYPPLFYWLNGLALRAFGLSFAPGRALSALAALAAASLLWYLSASLTGEPLAGVLAALFYLTQPSVRSVAALARVDQLAGFLAFAGLVVVLRRRGQSGLWPAAALFALGLATKHSAVVAPAAACLGLATRAPRRGLLLAGLTAGFTAAWLALGLALYGPVMLTNLGPYTAAPLNAARFKVFAANAAREFLPGLVALVVAAAWFVRRGSTRLATAVLYGLLAVASLATLAKEGSTLLYLSDFAIAMALMVGLASGCALAAAGRLKPLMGALAVLVACGAFLMLRSPPPANPVAYLVAEARDVWTYDLSARRAADNEMVERLATVEGPVLAESADLALAAGKPVVANTFVLTWMARLGRWDEARLLEDLARHRFAAVQLDSFAAEPPPRSLSAQERYRYDITRTRLSPAVLKAIERHYEVSVDLARGTIYRPRPSS